MRPAESAVDSSTFMPQIGAIILSISVELLLGHSHHFVCAATSRFALGLGFAGCGHEFLPTMVAAEIKRLSIAFGMESGGFVHGHPADGVFGYGFRFIHNLAHSWLLSLHRWVVNTQSFLG